MLRLCGDTKGSFDEITLLLKSRDKGAAVNATFEDVHVSVVAVHCSALSLI